jgi:hypothetical protein
MRLSGCGFHGTKKVFILTPERLLYTPGAGRSGGLFFAELQ